MFSDCILAALIHQDVKCIFFFMKIYFCTKVGKIVKHALKCAYKILDLYLLYKSYFLLYDS